MRARKMQVRMIIIDNWNHRDYEHSPLVTEAS